MMFLKWMHAFKTVLGEPIRRKIIFMMVVFFVALAVLIGTAEYMRHSNLDYQFAHDNQTARSSLGKIILNRLLHIELDMKNMTSVQDERELSILQERIQKSIGDIRTVLAVLQKGGTFENLLPANFDDVDVVRENIPFFVQSGSGYVVEVIDLTPKIIDIQEIAEALSLAVRKRLEEGEKGGHHVASRHADLLEKQASTFLLRSRESADKIFYETQKEITRLEERKGNLDRFFLVVRLGIAAVICFLCTVMGILTTRQIGGILKEREETASDLEKAREYMEMVLDAVPVGVVMMGTDYRIRSINKAGVQLLGAKDSRDVLGKKCSELFCRPQEDTCPFTNSGIVSHDMEIELQKINGKKVPVIKNAIFLQLKEEPLILEAFIDISRRKQAESELLEKQKFIDDIVNSAPVGIAVIDAQTHTIIDMNLTALKMIGHSREKALGSSCHRFLCPNEIGRCPITDMKETIDHSERILVNALGNPLNILKSVVSTTVQGRTCLVESFVDITDFKRAEKETLFAKENAEKANKALARVNAELEESIDLARQMAEKAGKASSAKSEFLANMSHEIRTPLNGVIGMLNLLEESSLTKENREYVEMAGISADSLLGVINNILDFSKIEAGRLDIEAVAFDLQEEVSRLMAVFGRKAENKNVELILRYDAEAPRCVLGDSIRIRQILNNLVGNALKFTMEGFVLLDVHCRHADEFFANLEISVTDTGIGIPADKIDMIFEHFSQADASTTRKFGGTGLGLAICRNLVKLMGGELKATSIPGEKTRFYFTLNLPLDKKAHETVVEAPKLNVGRVLVVDDNDINLRIFSEYLSSWGVRHETCGDSGRVLDLLNEALKEKDPYAIVLTDYLMPGLDGVDLCLAIKSGKDLRNIKVVVAASQDGPEDKKRIMSAGFSSHLVKPVSPSDLFNLLCSVQDNVFCSSLSQTGVLHESRKQRLAGSVHGAAETRVLLVEDHPINQQAIIPILKKMGFKDIVVADNGLLALEMISNSRFDLVLMDIQMPYMDGYETTQAIRMLSGGVATVPIIAMTANAMEGDREKCLESGMNDYLSKPIQKKALLDVLNRWVRPAETASPAELDRDGSNAESGNTEGLVFDADDAIERYGGDRDILKTIIESFIADSPQTLAVIENALKSGDVAAAGARGHALKGGASYIGAQRIRSLALNLENAGKAGDLPTAEAALYELRKEFKFFENEIAGFCWEDGGTRF